jgi:FkbM family methyltransferase
LLGVKNWPHMLALFLHLPVPRPFVLELRNGYRFHIRTAMDAWIIKEICLDHQYEHASLPFEDGWTVLDVGAGLGDLAVTMAKQGPHSRICAYEPFPESFALLQENLRRNQVQNVQAFPTAISAQPGPQRFHIASEAVAHTTITTGDSPPGDSIEVQSVTLDQVFAEQHLSRCDYLKMDCEGAEYEILFNASASTLQKIKHLCLEFHDGCTAFSHQDLICFFEERGFQVRITPCPAYRHLGLLYAVNPAL